MPRKPMTNLYYTRKKLAREDCDTLRIDRRRVRTIRDGFETHVWDGEKLVRTPVVACLRVATSLVNEVGVDALQNDDSEDYGF